MELKLLVFGSYTKYPSFPATIPKQCQSQTVILFHMHRRLQAVWLGSVFSKTVIQARRLDLFCVRSVDD
jgi:hypothetical protein